MFGCVRQAVSIIQYIHFIPFSRNFVFSQAHFVCVCVSMFDKTRLVEMFLYFFFRFVSFFVVVYIVYNHQHHYIFFSSFLTTVLNLCAISVDRYLAVTRPVRYRSLMTAKRAKFIIACVWIISFIICFPPVSIYYGIEMKKKILILVFVFRLFC